jgi:hypothetical protein
LQYQGDNEDIKVDVNDDIPWPLDFHLIRFKKNGGRYIPDGPDVSSSDVSSSDVSTPEELDNKKQKTKNFINPKDLSVYQEYIVNYDVPLKQEIINMVASQSSSKITRFTLDNKGCLKLGGSRSNRKKQGKTKKKLNKLRKRRRTNKRKQNKRRSRKIR